MNVEVAEIFALLNRALHHLQIVHLWDRDEPALMAVAGAIVGLRSPDNGPMAARVLVLARAAASAA